MKRIILVSLVLLLAACGQKEPSGYTAPAVSAVAPIVAVTANVVLDGDYVGSRSKTHNVFKPDGTVSFFDSGVLTGKSLYKIDGDQILIKGFPYPLVIKDDRTIYAQVAGVTQEVLIKQ